MAKTYQQFKKEYLGKAVDLDGYYGCQCWDGAMAYSQWLGYPVYHCGVTGYVQDIWTQRKTNGILNYYNEEAIMHPGDIVVFKKSASTPYSHIAIFDSDIDGKQGKFLGQNQGAAGGAFNIVTLPYSATYDTVFRPKCFVGEKTEPVKNTTTKKDNVNVSILNKKPAQFVEETGTFTVTINAIKIRKAPYTKGADTGLIYKKGASVQYDGYVINDGHVWISWISTSDNTRRWMAAGEVDTSGRNVNPYGTFA